MLLGWMSTRVLGQYDLLVVEDPADAAPEDQDLVYYVGPNVLALEKRFAFPPKEFRLWLALHEVTHRAQFTGVPWLRAHYLGARAADARLGRPRPEAAARRARRGSSRSCARAATPLDDGGLAALLASPEQRAVLDKIGGLMSLLEGHGDVTMDRAGADRIPSADRFARVLRERRANANPARQAAAAADRARGQDQPVRAGRAVHRRGRAARRRPGGPRARVAGRELAADARRDPRARGVARPGPALRRARRLTSAVRTAALLARCALPGRRARR